MSAQAASSETSKKLKAAIRAKLEELGVYVDDELPDYIMVMIANKKEKSQMKDDLGLFIGKSTAKFVDWLFDLFDRLTSASSKHSSDESKKAEEEEKQRRQYEEDRQREREREREREHEREKERERERVREREREKERERKKEREREMEREQERKRERERETRRREEKPKRRRSRSNTYSDEEDRKRSRSERRVASTVVQKAPSKSPEPQRVQSTVAVKRNIRSSGDKANAKARSSMFLRAMNEASVSAGYASRKSEDGKNDVVENEDDDMSDFDALPTKQEEKSEKKKKKKSLKERMEYKKSRHANSDDEDDDAVVLNSHESSKGGPQMIIKLAGGKEAIKKLRVHDRIVVPDTSDRMRLKRKRADDDDDADNRKHQRIVFDLTPSPVGSSPSADSPTLKKWDGQIDLAQESETSDEEAEIDAMLAETRGYHSKHGDEDEQLPPTHQLSGSSYSAPAYIPTPIHQLQEKEHQALQKERCIFWPKCTKGEACHFHHPVKNCTNFPNCTFGSRCLFIHPPCRFDKFCTKKQCPFLHYGTGGIQPTAPASLPITGNKFPSAFVAPPQLKPAEQTEAPKIGVLSSIAAKLVASVKKTDQPATATSSEAAVPAAPIAETSEQPKPAEESKEKLEESVQATPAPPKPATESPLQNMIPCRFAAACRNPGCHFKHPKECKFGANCRNSYCYFYHKPAAPPTQNSEALAKFKWTAPAAATSA